MWFLRLKFLVCTIILFTQCKSLRENTNAARQTLPPKYTEVQDSVNSAKILWKDFFKDSLLLNLIEEAITKNNNLNIALQRIEAGKAELRMAKGAMLPQINANGAFLQRKFGLYTMDGAGNISTDILPGKIVPIHLPDYFVGFQASWEIDTWGKLKNKKKAAYARFLKTVEAKNLILTNLVAQISSDYYTLITLDKKLEVIKEFIIIQQKALELVTLQKQAGAANELVVKQFKAQLLNSQALEFEVKQQIGELENHLCTLLGKFPQTINRKQKGSGFPFNNNTGSGIPSDLLQYRPDIKAAELEIVASHADLKAARRAFYPTLSLSGSYGYQAFNTSLLFLSPESIAYSLLANLAMPIINRSALKANFGAANARQAEAIYGYNQSILMAYTEVKTELNNIENLEKIINLKTQEAEVLSESVDVSSELFKSNGANYLEVLMTQKNALNTKLEILAIRQYLGGSYINLYKALGGGWQ